MKQWQAREIRAHSSARWLTVGRGQVRTECALAPRAAKSYPMTVNRMPCADNSVVPPRLSHSGRLRRARTAIALFAALATTTANMKEPLAKGVVHPDLESALAELDRAKGAESYAALRRVWDTWDRADPAQVEEALVLAAKSKHLDASAQAYAGTLAAYARLRRGDLKAARDRLHALGYVDRWLSVGPFDNDGKAGLTADSGPELDFAQPLSTAKAYTGRERAVRWRALPDAFSYGFLDFGSIVRPERQVCAFAATFVKGPDKDKARDLSVWVGSGGAFRLFWNGSQVLDSDIYSRHDFERQAVSVRLEPGPNLLALKVCGDDQAPTVSVRVADARGVPDPKITYSNDLSEAEAAAALVQQLAKSKSKGKAVTSNLEGPVQYFTRLTSKANASSAALEAHARYLDETDGDDPAQHLARDLARRAAEREPTVERLLLAGKQAEDRNKAGEWIEKAEKLTKNKPNRDVLLARAWQRRHGPNFREALPYFDAVLKLDATNVEALRGILELYDLAGLPRTALARVEQALERNPTSVGLLALYAAQLRTLGRTSDAADVEARYHGLRFDDSGYVNTELELALARRDKQGATHWAERLTAAQPHDIWALGVAARAYRRLGEPDRAVATHRQALSLAPEDVGSLRALADLQGELGHAGEQLTLLQEILRVRPQAKDVREYVENLEPEKPRADEAYAWSKEKFLFLRHAPPAGENRRVLRDLNVTTVFENGLSSQFHQIVFQPLTDAAAAQDRQYAFGYEADRQVVQLRGAKVYRKNGKVDEAIEWGEGPADDPTIAMYTSARTFYVQLPRLDSGDVVELRYRIDDVTPRNDFKDYFGDVEYMGGRDPLQNSEYVLITPKSRKILVDAQVPGLEQTTQEGEHAVIHRFFAKQAPRIQPEPAMPPLSEVLPFIHVSTYQNWKDLGRWYWGLVKDQFDLDDETRQLAHKIVNGKKTELEKVQAIYDWVTKNTRYVALEFGIYGYKPRRCVQTIARGWGDCKDKATVLATLLKEVGVPSTIVVLRTQMRGDFRSKLASFAPFDHAIAYVPSLDMYLDGTAEHTGVTELPRMDLGALGLLVNQGDAKLTRLPEADPDKNFVRRTARAKLAANGEAKLEMEFTTGGFVSAEWRRRYHAESTLRDRVNSDLGSEYPGFELLPGAQGLTTSNLEDATAPVRIQIKGTAASFARHEGSDLSMAITTSTRLTPTFASLSTRTQDVMTLGFSTTEDNVTVELPPGAQIVSAPESAHQDGPFGSFSVEVTKEKDKVSVKSRVSVKVSRIKPKDYDAWRRFCDAADRALAPRLVIHP
jgi:transglutaminase-like putative cysteine protease/tetratricopeptide (TPR) repeat protein